MQATATPLPSVPWQAERIFLLALILMVAPAGDGQLTFQSLIDQAKGDILGHLKFQCTNCGSRLTDAAVSWSHGTEAIADWCRA